MQPQTPDKKLLIQASQALSKLKNLQTNPQWQQFSLAPCKMSRMYIGNRLLSKGQASIHLKMRDLVATLIDEEEVKNLNCQLKEVTVLRDLGDGGGDGNGDGLRAKVNYLCFEGAWPIQARDFVNVTVCEEGEKIAYIASMASSYVHPKVQNVTRAICHIVGYVLEKIDQENTWVTYISDVDLAGSIPQAVKNKLIERQASMPKTIEEVFLDNPEPEVSGTQKNSSNGNGPVDFSTLD